MKVLIYSKASESQDVFEAMRLRKNLKGACELAGITHVKSALDVYDIAHFISANDESVINDTIELHKPVVLSALMCESDPTARMIITKDKEESLSPKALRVLNKVNMIFVPSLQAQQFLQKQGITRPIEIVPSGVNISRFQPINDAEKDIFFRYFSIDKKDRIVVSVADYDNPDEVDMFIDIAKKCPEAKFFFLGQSKRHLSLSRRIKKILIRTPSNVYLNQILDDDVYRSLMMNADIYLSLSPRKGSSVTILDAMAAKCQIITYQKTISNESLLTSENSYSATSVDELINCIHLYLSDKLPSKVDKSYADAKKNSLYEIGKLLKKYYTQLIDESEEIKHD